MKKITGWMMMLAVGAALAVPAVACERVNYGTAYVPYATYGTVVRPDAGNRYDMRRDVRNDVRNDVRQNVRQDGRENARQNVRNEAPARTNYARR